MEKEILENAEESLESTQDDLDKNRFNSTISSFFRAIANFCDYLIYKEIKIFPKNHGERFTPLEKYFPELNDQVREVFEKYRETYNLRLTKEDALKVKGKTYEIQDIAKNKN